MFRVSILFVFAFCTKMLMNEIGINEMLVGLFKSISRLTGFGNITAMNRFWEM